MWPKKAFLKWNHRTSSGLGLRRGNKPNTRGFSSSHANALSPCFSSSTDDALSGGIGKMIHFSVAAMSCIIPQYGVLIQHSSIFFPFLSKRKYATSGLPSPLAWYPIVTISPETGTILGCAVWGGDVYWPWKS